MNYGSKSRRDGPASACTTRERKTMARSQHIKRPKTVATGESKRNLGRTVSAKTSKTESWLQRAKVYEDSFVVMKSRNEAKKQNVTSHTPQAYDLEEHLDCDQGVVIIGKNGIVSNNNYYVKCMKRSRPEPSTGSDVDSSFLSSEDESSMDASNEKDKVPLCWRQQLVDRDVVRVCLPTTYNTITPSVNAIERELDTEIADVEVTSVQPEEVIKQKTVDHQSFVNVMLSWGMVCVLDWKDCLSPDPKSAVETTPCLPSLEALLDHIKECDHSFEWRHICSTLCIWLSWSPINEDITFDVYITDNAPVCTRAFSSVKARKVYNDISIIHFNLVNSLPWVTNLSEVHGKQMNIAVVSSCNPVESGGELKLLCEMVQLGSPFEDNWCNPRAFSNFVSSNEDLDEDRTDLLAISDLLPDLLKFSPNGSLDTPRDQSLLCTDVSTTKGLNLSTTSQPVISNDNMMTQNQSLWQHKSASTVNYGGLHDKGILLSSELALSRSIRNYNHKQRHHSPIRSKNTLVRPNTSIGYKSRRQQQAHSAVADRRSLTSTGHKKYSIPYKAKVRPFTAVPANNTNTTKDLEMLTKSLCRQLCIKNNLH